MPSGSKNSPVRDRHTCAVRDTYIVIEVAAAAIEGCRPGPSPFEARSFAARTSG